MTAAAAGAPGDDDDADEYQNGFCLRSFAASKHASHVPMRLACEIRSAALASLNFLFRRRRSAAGGREILIDDAATRSMSALGFCWGELRGEAAGRRSRVCGQRGESAERGVSKSKRERERTYELAGSDRGASLQAPGK